MPGHLKKPLEQMQKKPDSMLKRPEWRRRAPERFLSGRRQPLSVLKRPDVWLRMPEDLKAIRARKEIQENEALRECRVLLGRLAQQDLPAHVVRQAHKGQWGRVVKPGPEAKKETRAGLRDPEVSADLQAHRVHVVKRDQQVRKVNEAKPGHEDLKEKQGRRAELQTWLTPRRHGQGLSGSAVQPTARLKRWPQRQKPSGR